MNYLEFGKKIKSYREEKGRSITEVAEAIGVDRTYISKLENGHERPSILILNRLTDYYSLSGEETSKLFENAGYIGGTVNLEKREGVAKMQTKKLPVGGNIQQTQMQVNVPGNIPALYSDSVFVTASQWGIVFDFAQNIGPTNQQNVVARIGMSKEHAKALLDVLRKRLEGPDKK